MKIIATAVSLALVTTFCNSAKADLLFDWDNGLTNGWTGINGSTVSITDSFSSNESSFGLQIDYSASTKSTRAIAECTISSDYIPSFVDMINTGEWLSFDLEALDIESWGSINLEITSDTGSYYQSLAQSPSSVYSTNIKSTLWQPFSANESATIKLIINSNAAGSMNIDSLQSDGYHGAAVVPEPKTYALFVGIFAIGLMGFRRFRNRKSA